MLIVKRFKNQKIRINDNIVIEILSINGPEVTVGVKAPKSIGILRGEFVGPCNKVKKELK
jgi:carbon storage regulator